jgi:hypothetical protein
MGNAILAGLTYFSLTFAAGFLLGVVRTVVLAPYIGDSIAVAIELPIILTISWVACSWTIQRSSLPALPTRRIVMGGSALLFLLAAEIILSLTLANRSLTEHLMLYRTLPALMGLMGQILFALFPLIQTSSPLKTT